MEEPYNTESLTESDHLLPDIWELQLWELHHIEYMYVYVRICLSNQIVIEKPDVLN